MPKQFTLTDENWSKFVSAVVFRKRLGPISDEQKDAAAVAELRSIVGAYIGKAAGGIAAAQAEEAIRQTTTIENISE